MYMAPPLHAYMEEAEGSKLRAQIKENPLALFYRSQLVLLHMNWVDPTHSDHCIQTRDRHMALSVPSIHNLSIYSGFNFAIPCLVYDPCMDLSF